MDDKKMKKQIVLVKSSSQKRVLAQNNTLEHRDAEQVKLTAPAISLNIRLTMPISMQERALCLAKTQLDSSPSPRRPNLTLLARTLKKEFDSVYGPAWHCVVGKSFGSFVTHSPGGFVYFSLDSLSCLLFNTAVRLLNEPSPTC